MTLVRVGERSVFRERWVIHAFRRGQILPLTPRYFPIYDSKMELLEAVRERIETDAVFATRWHGWMLIPVDFNQCIIVKTLPQIVQKGA